MTAQAYICKRKGGIYGNVYCGMLQVGDCIEIQTADYGSPDKALHALNVQIRLRGFKHPMQTFKSISLRDYTKPAPKPPAKRGRKPKQAVKTA